jgi:uncharacterized membrane protein HdeD (DUF308 family)
MLVLANLSRNWWVFVLRGIVAILFGVFAFTRPGMTLELLVYLFAFWALFDGVFALIASIGVAGAREPWWPLVLTGLLGIAAGLVTLRWPQITAAALYFIIAYWAIFQGVLEVVAAIRLRDLIPGEGWFIAGGLASIAFGVLLFMYPASGLLAVIWLIGLYAVIFGIALLMLGFRLKGAAGEIQAVTPRPARAH